MINTLISEAKIKEGFILISAGLFTEALDMDTSVRFGSSSNLWITRFEIG